MARTVDEYALMVQEPYVWVCLTRRQWDVVRDALVQRGTKQADAMRERIWQQGGGTQFDGGDA